MLTDLMTNDISIAAAPISPLSLAAATPTGTGGVDMNKFFHAMFVLNVGVFGGSATVDMKLQESNDPTFVSGTSDITGAAITTLAAAGGNNRLATIEIRKTQTTKRYVRALVTVGTAATLLGCVAYGANEVTSPASAVDVAAVAQRKTITTGVPSQYSSLLLVKNVQ